MTEYLVQIEYPTGKDETYWFQSANEAKDVYECAIEVIGGDAHITLCAVMFIDERGGE